MIIEGILTTETELGEMHIAPIGPHVDRELQKWTLKPFQTSTTFRNLKRSGRCVFHVIDDGLLLVQSILGMCNTKECMPKARYENGFGWVLSDSCRVFPLIVNKWDVSSERAIAECGKVTTLELRPFWGWNRAVHSLLELSIHWSRRDRTPREIIETELAQHRVIIGKTAGDRENLAMELLEARFLEYWQKESGDQPTIRRPDG